MLVFPCVCFIAAFLCSADGQGDRNEICKQIEDFNPCKEPWTCNVAVSQCYCKTQTPYCRCKNYIDEFYLGKSCSQKWTTLSFALVATLPGVVLAFVIGVSVHLAHRFGKSTKSHGAGNELTDIPEQVLSPRVIFASNMESPLSAHTPHLPPPPGHGLMPVQMGVPMSSPRPYSVSGKTHISEPPMGAPRQQYSYTGGRDQAQVPNNPYSRARNPYEEQNVSDQLHNQPDSPQAYEEQRMAPPPAPPFSAPECCSMFPRAQVGRLY
ncbi:uncharacterized protein zgc:158432 [Tachysurus fulvidraco]|uniref:uncharacterized protein zgc:158432 n=1 Tax=Tachysurus fulvidraco TaxID=1234273 RepID=UPI000F4E3063|nr:uncharacterized protein zgc:158432 [Tachysurus fulvidraco]